MDASTQLGKTSLAAYVSFFLLTLKSLTLRLLSFPVPIVPNPPGSLVEHRVLPLPQSSVGRPTYECFQWAVKASSEDG